MSIRPPKDPWAEEVRRSAYIAVELATAKREACERTFLYFLRSAMAHGLTLAELSEASGLDADTIRTLTEPAAA